MAMDTREGREDLEGLRNIRPTFNPSMKPDAASGDIRDFGERVEELSPRFFDVADRLFAIGTGEDPLFTDMQGGMFDLLRAEEDNRVRDLEEMFARRGAGGTGAAQDALSRLRSDFSGKRTRFGNQLALQRLDVLGGSLDPFTAGIETESIPLQLRIALENARNAGETGDDDDGLLGLGIGPI